MVGTRTKAPQVRRWITNGSAGLALVAMLGLSACSSSSTDSSASATAGQPGASASAASPTSSGPKVTAAQLQPVLKKAAADYHLPGAVVGYWQPGQDPVVITEGMANVKSKKPMSAADTFNIASTTKSFVGTVALQLVDEGKLSLDDPISKFLPDFPNGENITVRQLIDMTSGISDYSYDPKILKKLSADPSTVFPRAELVAAAAKGKPVAEPGAGVHYSNSNTVLLGLIIEKVTGNKLESEVTKRLIEPLGLTSTTFPVDAAASQPTATGYQLDPETGKFVEPPALDPSFLWAAGAMISNVEDLGKWARALASGELISKDLQAQREQFKPLSVAGAPEFYTQMNPGYGLAMERYAAPDQGGQFIGHSGRSITYNTQMYYHPDNDSVLVTLANTDTVSGYGPLFFVKMAQAAIPGSFPDVDPSATAVPSPAS